MPCTVDFHDDIAPLDLGNPNGGGILESWVLLSVGSFSQAAEGQEVAGYGTVFVPDHDLLRTRIGFGSSFTWHFTDRVGIRFYSTRRTSVTLIPAVGQFHFESRQERDDSGRVRGSIEDTIGLHLRLQIAALPLDSAPLGLTLEVLGASAIPTGDLIEDVYAPFEV